MQSSTKIYRRGKQCRERWNNYLDPEINRGEWTDEEDYKLLQIVYDLASNNYLKRKWVGSAR